MSVGIVGGASLASDDGVRRSAEEEIRGQRRFGGQGGKGAGIGGGAVRQ